MTYSLNSPVPAITNCGTVSEGVSTSGSRAMFKDTTNNVVHIFAVFGDSPWYVHHVNTGTEAHSILTAPTTLSGDARLFAYNPTANRFYISGKYYRVLSEFNPVAATMQTISDLGAGSCSALCVGDDGLVYWSPGGNRVLSYDPALGVPAGIKDYGVPTGATGYASTEYTTIAVVDGYLYVGCTIDSANAIQVSVTPTTGDISWTSSFNGAGDKSYSLHKIHNQTYYQLVRELSDSSQLFYLLDNGSLTPDTGEQGEYMGNYAPYWATWASNDYDSAYNYNSFYGDWGWDVDFSDLFPIKDIHEDSIVGASSTDGGPYTYYQSTFTGSWVAQVVRALLPTTGSVVFGLTSGYNAAISLSYPTPATNYLGSEQLSPYCAMRHSSGQIYGSGYANQLFRYNPDFPWTLTNSNRTPLSGAPDPTWAVNPYFINLGATSLHYRHHMDYDSNGLVWIGGNTTRLSPNYGDVMWYDPADGSTGYMFPGWAAAGTGFGDVCAANGRTQICVSDSLGNIWLIDADTKAIDETPIRPVDAEGRSFMVEVAPDVVLGVYMTATATDARIFRFKPSTKEILTTAQILGVDGQPFGWASSEANRRYWKLELGPDGYVWMFVGNYLCRVNPTTCEFTQVKDCSGYYQLKFSATGTDVLLYANGTDFKYIPGLLLKSSGRLVYGVENVKVYGGNTKLYGMD